jgi:ATP-dependent helicase/nuclease subunit A
MNAPPDAAASQRDAARPDHCAWVAANAGSGKTKVLIDRVARLLLAGAAPDSILCVTYTKAAASEMQTRLFERLGAWCVMDRERLAGELADLEERATGSFSDDDIGRARELFARALETPGGLRIETIHAFCGRLLRRFPLEAGIAPGFRELDDAEAGDIWRVALRRLGAAAMSGDRLLSEATLRAARAGGDPARLLEEISGLRTRIEPFLRRHGDVGTATEAIRRILSAPEEDETTLLEDAMGPALPRDALARALGAFGAGSLQAKAIEIALSDAPASNRFAGYRKLVFTAKGEIKARKSVLTKALVKDHPFLVDLFDVDLPQGTETLRLQALDAALRSRRIFERSAALVQLASVVFETFSAAKRARAGLDFDDLIDRTRDLLSNPSASDWVLWKLDGGIAHILLDEAQDTSPRQWSILNRLGEDIFAGRGAERERPRTWFVVGDQKQSIYSFQGADPEHFLEETRTFETRAIAGGVRYTQPVLAASFRSTPDVLWFVDAVFDPSGFEGAAPFSLQPPVDADQPRHVAFRAKERGAVEIWPLEPRPDKAATDAWDAPRGQETESSPRSRLAGRIARRIREEIEQGAAVWDRGRQRAARAGDYLILVRKRGGGLFTGLLLALKREGLRVAGADRIQLLDSLAVQDLLNLMRFVLCPEDDLTLAEILKSPFAGLDDDDLVALAAERTGRLWDALAGSSDPRHAAIRARLHDMLETRGLAPVDFLIRQLERPGPDGQPGWEKMLARFGDPAREPITALIDRAASYDASAPPSLEGFVAAIEQRGGEVKRELSGPADEVRVMTVHGAKGLEAPIVILPDTTSAPKADAEDVFLDPEGAPLWVGKAGNDVPVTAKLRRLAQDLGASEHRRLLYVALTRARDRLVICGAAQGSGAEGRNPNSWHALCERGMARLPESERSEDVVSADSPPILRYGELAVVGADTATEGVTGPRPGWIDRAVAATAPIPRILAPSGLGGDDPPVLAPFGAARQARLRRGRIIHRLLQHLPGLATAERAAAADRMLARETDLSRDARAEMREAAIGLMEDSRFSALFGPGGRAEAPVIGRLGRDIINGRVDRLAITDSEVLVIDYKTDRPAPADLGGVGEAYVRQMAAYRRILSEAWPGRTVRCLLAWTDGPALMELPAAQLDRALADIK